jgi:signal peptidase I
VSPRVDAGTLTLRLREFGPAAGRRAVQAVWTTLVPLLLVGVVLRYLVPIGGDGLRGAVASVAHRHTLLFAVVLYFVFSGLVRYWRDWLPGSRYAWPQATGVAPAADPARGRREAFALVAMVAGAVVVALGFRTYVARPYEVLSTSMLPTLETGDLLGGRMRRYEPPSHLPSRGDIVVFRSSAIASGPVGLQLPETLVKRVIGLPGDRIGMRGGIPIINGWMVPNCDVGPYMYVLPEPGDPGIQGRLHMEFLGDRAYLTVQSTGAPFDDVYVVRPGEVFVLGDNRGNSADSRSFNGGHGGGVSLDGIDAEARWFLIGANQSGGADLSRLFKPLDGLQARIRIGGVKTELLESGIARCLRDRPSDTHPPAP